MKSSGGTRTPIGVLKWLPSCTRLAVGVWNLLMKVLLILTPASTRPHPQPIHQCWFQSSMPGLRGVSEPVLTQLRLTPDNSDPVPTRYVPPRFRSPSSLFPLALIPTSSSFPTPYPSPLYPTSDYASFKGTPIPFWIFSFVLVPLRTMSSLSPTPDALCLSFDYVITLDRVSPLRFLRDLSTSVKENGAARRPRCCLAR